MHEKMMILWSYHVEQEQSYRLETIWKRYRQETSSSDRRPENTRQITGCLMRQRHRRRHSIGVHKASICTLKNKEKNLTFFSFTWCRSWIHIYGETGVQWKEYWVVYLRWSLTTMPSVIKSTNPPRIWIIKKDTGNPRRLSFWQQLKMLPWPGTKRKVTNDILVCIKWHLLFHFFPRPDRKSNTRIQYLWQIEVRKKKQHFF